MPDMHFFFENTTCQKAVNEVKSVKYDPKTLKFKLENLYGLGGQYKVQAVLRLHGSLTTQFSI